VGILGASIVTAYYATLALLAAYGWHRYHLLRLYRRHPPGRPRPALPCGALPVITVQLPIYNERLVVDRLIRAACDLDYPSGRLEIQVLDDSTDDTSAIAAAAVDEMRRQGRDIRHLRRPFRDGFKAGALAAGLDQARGELVAVFDADFLPGPSFLLDLAPFFSDPRTGMVQARWGHLNRDYSALTRSQAIFLDGHFVIEHAARHRAGRFFNFNGTAGLWRRACIESAGGWQSDTLTEDLDLSYRAQLQGWEFVFVPEVVVPAELPADIDSFQAQQHRWTMGSIQTARKILPRLLRARLPAPVRIEALFHLTGNLSYPLMVLLALLIVPATAVRSGAGQGIMLALDLPLFLLTTLSVMAFYVGAQRRVRDDWPGTLPDLPVLMCVGIGLSLTNARAVCAALLGLRRDFARTPKRRLIGRSGDWQPPIERSAAGRAWAAVELLFGIYFAGAATWAILAGHFASLPLFLMFLAGYLARPILALAQAVRPRSGPSIAVPLTQAEKTP
jgi:cellulose synthase/poly-beta-1,6-N-acetylglucosamine synthase-like glycosyltransferase